MRIRLPWRRKHHSWLATAETDPHHVHVLPLRDQVRHDPTGTDCVCGPTVEAVMRDDGSNGWLVTHHSIDGRETNE